MLSIESLAGIATGADGGGEEREAGAWPGEELPWDGPSLGGRAAAGIDRDGDRLVVAW